MGRSIEVLLFPQLLFFVGNTLARVNNSLIILRKLLNVLLALASGELISLFKDLSNFVDTVHAKGVHSLDMTTGGASV